mgnify:CR=1 FL=1|jgi:hypothetical protein
MANNAGKATTTTPTIATATSTQLLAANGYRKLLVIQNNSAADVAIGLDGETLTGIAPTSTNKCYVLKSTAGLNILRFDNNFVPSGAITCYQTSGSPINTVTVVEGV